MMQEEKGRPVLLLCQNTQIIHDDGNKFICILISILLLLLYIKCVCKKVYPRPLHCAFPNLHCSKWIHRIIVCRCCVCKQLTVLCCVVVSFTDMQQFGVGSLLRYENFVQIGEGAYGHVYRARDKQQQQQQQLHHKEVRATCRYTGEGEGGGGEEAGMVAIKRLIVPIAKEQAGVSHAV